MTVHAHESGRAAATSDRFSVFRNRNFTLLWLGLLVSHSGAWMQMVAQGLLVYELSGSPFILGLVGMARAIPMILIAPIGGVIADRVPRLKLLKVTQSVGFGLALLLAVLVSTGLVEVWQIFLISLLSAAVNAFDQPTRQALIPDLVRREDLSRAIALNSSSWQGSALFGPTLAGITVAAIGLSGAFYANAFGILAVVAAVYLMRGVPEYSAAGQRRTIAGDLVGGLSYVRASSLIFALLAMASITSIFGRSYQQLLPVFAVDIFDQGGIGYGLLLTAPGAAALCGGLALAVMPDSRYKGRAFLVCTVLFSLSLMVFAANRSFLLGLGLLFFSGLVAMVFSTMMTTMLQLTVRGDMRGRVMSLVTVTMQGFAPIGGLLTGAVATRIGTPEAVAASAAVVGLAALAAFALSPSIRNFKADAPATSAHTPAAPAAGWPGAARAMGPAPHRAEASTSEERELPRPAPAP